MDPAVLDTALNHVPVNDDGRSGATLERVLRVDGSRAVVKHLDPVDLAIRPDAVDMAFEPGRPGSLTLIGLGSGRGASELEIGRLLGGCAPVWSGRSASEE